MYCEVFGATVFGLSAYPVRVEVDAGPGLPCFEMSGYLNNEVREARERVKIAIKNSGFKINPQRIVINYSPADIRKHGTGLDLPTAIGLLGSNGFLSNEKLEDIMFIGELGFDGSLRPVRGCMACVFEARKKNFKYAVIPEENRDECFYVKGIHMISAKNLKEITDLLDADTFPEDYRKNYTEKCENDHTHIADFFDIKGQDSAKKATLIAAAGMHNIIYIGSPGSGKSMFAKRIPYILPPMSHEEKLELTKIYSVAGKLKKDSVLINSRPFRAPGQNITETALLGGGHHPEPGEITLASKGVLFLDEMTQYKSAVLEALRQPLEDKSITVSRSVYSVTYPADFMLVAAINPCKCGFYPDRNRCSCSDLDIRRFFGKISGPLYDRFDLRIQTEIVGFTDMFGTPSSVSSSMTTKEMREKVCASHDIQKKRFAGRKTSFNSEMTEQEIKEFCILGPGEMSLMESLYKKMSLTARGCNKILKLARTIADIDGEEKIRCSHISMAAVYRNKAL